MTDPRSRIVERVVRSLDESRDPEKLVRSYFESDRVAMVEATRETLEATREETSDVEIEEALERELIEALRHPVARRRGVLPHLWVRRRVLAAGVLTLILAALVVVIL